MSGIFKIKIKNLLTITLISLSEQSRNHSVYRDGLLRRCAPRNDGDTTILLYIMNSVAKVLLRIMDGFAKVLLCIMNGVA
jgi:hypothetical protein